MLKIQHISSARILAGCIRLFWTVLALLHLRVLAALFGGENGAMEVLGALVLILVIALFALKALDVPFLRLGTRKRSVLVFCLATAIVHHDAIAPENTDISVLPAVVTVLGVASFIEVSRRGARLMRSWHHLPGVMEPLFALWRAIAWLPFATQWIWRTAPIPERTSPRAPPR